MTGSKWIASTWRSQASGSAWSHVLGIDVRREIRTRDDLRLLGPMPEEDLARRPLEEWLPRGVRERPDTWVVVESEPFTAVARAQVFPRRWPLGARWLFAGPTGPHVIGRAARENARALGSPPFCLDFDPRWAKRLEPPAPSSRDL